MKRIILYRVILEEGCCLDISYDETETITTTQYAQRVFSRVI